MVTRGNVAIYCYNALTAKMWDVTESTNGELTSSKTADTILAKYFSDFVNENGKMKLVEDAKVTLSGATTSEIGSNQIKINSDDLSKFIDAEKAPRKDKEAVTYKVDADNVVAYVPTTVANIANLAGKTVDVIFGEDNEVAYLVVTDDALESAYVTAFDKDDEEIEIDGTVYDIADDVEVSVFGYEIGTGVNTIDTLLVTKLGITNPSKYMTRNVIAETTLDADDEVETINFKFSAAYTGTSNSKDLVVSEYVVEKVSSKNVLTTTGSKVDVEKIEDKDDPRVIKNGEVATLYDIEVGDVVTEVKYDSKVVTVYVTTETVEGEVADYVAKTNTFEIDGTEYVSIAAPFYNEDGEDDDYTQASDADDLFNLFEEEEVTAYLNMAGEVVAMIGESEATGTVLGVVTAAAELDEDNDDVEYLKLRILAEDGSEKRYSVYNKKSGKDVRDAAEYGSDFEESTLTVGTLVRFEADSTRTIKSDDIEIVADAQKYDFKSNTDVTAKKVEKAGVAGLTVDVDAKTVELNLGSGNKAYRFSSATKVLNLKEEELISSWSVLTTDTPDDAFVTVDGDAWFFVKGSKIIYMVVSIDEANYGASDEQYGILVKVNKDKDEDDETIYVATVLVDGVEKTFECDSSVRGYDYGCFVSFKVTDGEFKDNPVKLVEKDFVDYVADLDDADALANVATYLHSSITYITTSTKLEAIKVDSVEEVDGDSYLVFEDDAADTIDLAKGYIVYDLANGEMLDEVNAGDYVVVLDSDADEDGCEIVIVIQ